MGEKEYLKRAGEISRKVSKSEQKAWERSIKVPKPRVGTGSQKKAH